MPQELYLFTDTNIFIQCKSLDQLDWSKLPPATAIRLLVSRPVQAEIDRQKGRGQDRLGKRARTTSALFREILSSKGVKVIREAGPRITIELRHDILPDPELSDRLEYSERDDQLVGIVSAFSKANLQLDVRLLTLDTGPMTAADMLGLAYVPIPDQWLLEPEPTETEKSLAKTQQELLRLQKAEPEFDISFSIGKETLTRWEGKIEFFEPLEGDKIDLLVENLKAQFPIKSDFKTREELARSSPGASIFDVVFSMALPSDDEVARYKRSYESWLQDCRKILKKVHHRLERASDEQSFVLDVTNNGVRPGKNAIFSIEASGNFQISRLRKLKDFHFPAPPNFPKGLVAGIAAMQRFMGEPGGGALKFGPAIRSNPAHDMYGFYFRKGSREPGPSLELECDQWRHGVAPERFRGEIRLSDDWESGPLIGALSCSVHAENLSKPTLLRIPVRLEVVMGNTFEGAKTIIESLQFEPEE